MDTCILKATKKAMPMPWRQVPIVFAGSECDKDEDQVSWPVDLLAVLEPSVFLDEFPT